MHTPVWLSAQLSIHPSLQFRDFRFFIVASAFGGFAMMGEMVIIGWLALELTDSPLAVGLASSLRAAPGLLLGIPAGAIADFVDRRRFIRALSLVALIPTVGPAVLITAGLMDFHFVLLFAFLSGCVQAFRQTTGQSFTYDIVGPTGAARGMAIIALAQRSGGLAGAVAAGASIQQLGANYAYGLLAVAHLCAFGVQTAIRLRGQAAPLDQSHFVQNLREFVTEARRNRTLLTLSMLTAGVEVLGFSHQVLLPSLARDLLHLGPDGLGVLSGARSMGGIIGLLALSLVGEIRRKGIAFLIVIHVFGALLVLLGHADSLPLILICLIFLSGVAALSDVLSQAMMQLSVSNELRGRAMGSWIVAIGAGPLGQTQIGAVAALAGVSFALSLNGLALVALGLAAAVAVPSLRRL
ncbi:MAG: MFS transporter [Chloroflexi bacterium]|nr:MFS transporter [Chloroflexota bacterium]